MQTKITSHILYLVGYLRFAMKIHHKRHRSTRVGHRTSKDLAATKKWHGSLTYPWKIITFNKYIIEWASAQVPPTPLYLGGTVEREREREREGEREREREREERERWMDG